MRPEPHLQSLAHVAIAFIIPSRHNCNRHYRRLPLQQPPQSSHTRAPHPCSVITRMANKIIGPSMSFLSSLDPDLLLLALIVSSYQPLSPPGWCPSIPGQHTSLYPMPVLLLEASTFPQHTLWPSQVVSSPLLPFEPSLLLQSCGDIQPHPGPTQQVRSALQQVTQGLTGTGKPHCLSKGLATLNKALSPEEASDTLDIQVEKLVCHPFLQEAARTSHPPYWWLPSETPTQPPADLWALVMALSGQGLWLGPVTSTQSHTV